MLIRKKRTTGPVERLKQRRMKQQRKIDMLNFAEQLCIAGVSRGVAVKSLMIAHPFKVREARQAVDVVKPKKHRKRSGKIA